MLLLCGSSWGDVNKYVSTPDRKPTTDQRNDSTQISVGEVFIKVAYRDVDDSKAAAAVKSLPAVREDSGKLHPQICLTCRQLGWSESLLSNCYCLYDLRSFLRCLSSVYFQHLDELSARNVLI